MIADYLYNTPTLTGGQCVIVLLKQQYGNRSDFTAALVGKTLAEIAAQSNVIGISELAQSRMFGFMRARKLTGAYAGSLTVSNFEIPRSVTFSMARDGYATAAALCLVTNNVASRAVSMALQRVGDEATATRLVFSVDDTFVSKVEGPAYVGQPVGDVIRSVTHAPMQLVPSLIVESIVAPVVHQPMTSQAVTTPACVEAAVVHEPMQMVGLPFPSTIDKATLQSEFRAAVPGEYTLSSDERTLTKIGATDTSSRSFEVTGKPRPNTKCYMRVRFNGSPYPVVIISSGIVKANNQIAWTLGSLAANVWHEIKVEHVSADTYKYSVNGSVLYTGTATNLTFYSHTNVKVTEIDTGQLGTALPAGFVWL